MKPRLRQTLIGAAVATLVAAPTWAAGDASGSAGDVPQAESPAPMETMPQAQPQVPGPISAGNPLYAHTPDELRRVEVIDPTGERVGRVKTVVLAPDRESAHAVISSGGFLGFGAKEVLVPLDDLNVTEENKLQIGATREELQARDDYVPDQYVELHPERPISEFSAFEPMQEEPVRLPTMPRDPAAPAQ